MLENLGDCELIEKAIQTGKNCVRYPTSFHDPHVKDEARTDRRGDDKREYT